MNKKPRSGFTLIEMLIVVTIIGLILAIGIPNLLNAVQRAKQKRTLGDMRGIATAAEVYSIDFNAYPPSAAFTTEVLYGGLAYPTTSVGINFVNYVSPTYLKVIPLVDGWSSWFLYTSSRQDYAIVSCGKDGVAAQPLRTGPTTNFNVDLVFSDGQLTVYPEGVQD